MEIWRKWRNRRNGTEDTGDHGNAGEDAGRYGVDRVEIHPKSDEVKGTAGAGQRSGGFLPMFF